MSGDRIIETTGLNNCGGRCLLRAHVRDGKIIKMSSPGPEETDGIPLTACPKGLHCHETFFNPYVIRYFVRFDVFIHS